MIYDLNKGLDRVQFQMYYERLLKSNNVVSLKRLNAKTQEHVTLVKLAHLYIEYVSLKTDIEKAFIKDKLFKDISNRKFLRKTITLGKKTYAYSMSLSDVDDETMERCISRFREKVLFLFNIYLPWRNETTLIEEIKNYISRRNEENGSEKDTCGEGEVVLN